MSEEEKGKRRSVVGEEEDGYVRVPRKRLDELYEAMQRLRDLLSKL